MRLPIILFISALLILCITALFEVNFLNYAKPVPYSDYQKITFTDFKGLKKPYQALYGVKEFAFIKTSREIKKLSNNRLTITTYFHPSRSYVFNNYIRDKNLLNHELYHLHIAEYCSRLLRKYVFEHRGALTQRLLSELSEKYAEMENNLQQQYDEESYHSYVLSMQKKWESLIDENLKSLEKFQDPIVTLQ